jgi:glutamate N-acetyltransferase/amino-acid N-acetyltransferase
MKPTSGGITTPKGFLAAGLHAGIKKQRFLDLALVASVKPGPIAGLFTTNRVAAAPVELGRRQLRHGLGRAILINSGNANACTGRRGIADAESLIQQVAHALGADVRTVFMSSTGVIGQPLPVDRIAQSIPALIKALSVDGGSHAARAILTTDKKVKEVAVCGRIAGRVVSVGGMAKGSGMIHPNMATMLAYLTTDAVIQRSLLQRTLQQAVDRSFNCISVDGDTSTNDTVLCLANGLAGNRELKAGSSDFSTFQRLLDTVCHSLALQVCRDGEGVTKLVEICVRGARTVREARQVADAIATSSLVKTALFGEDANWGRIMAAIGRACVPIHQNRIALAIDGIPIVKRGVGLGPAAERRIAQSVRKASFPIAVDLGQGRAITNVWTTDLSYGYVKINASYRS